MSIVPKYAKYLKENGVEGILVNGTTGEGVSQSVEEREKTAEAWVEACKATGQTVMIQVGGTNLKDVKRLAAHAEKLRVSSILCLADLFHRPKNVNDLLDYLKSVSEAAPDTPLLYYHIPGFTGIDIDVKEMLEKADVVPTLVGLKFTDNDLSVGASCLVVGSGKHPVFLGSDTILAAALALGFDSAIGTTLNMLPKQNIEIKTAMDGGDVKRASEAQKILTSAVKSIFKHGSWVGTMKSAMNLMTPVDVGPVREPLKPIPPEKLNQLKQELISLKLFN